MSFKQQIKKICLQIPIVGRFIRLRQARFEGGFSFVNYIKFRFFTLDKRLYWPREETNIVKHPNNIIIGKNTEIGKNGCYIQGGGKLIIGDYVRFATNVGIITSNHKLINQLEHDSGKVIIGDYSWIGMNAVILPNVTLGPRSIVGAGSVVTKSFPEGYCVIAGNPAKLIKKIDIDSFVKPKYDSEFYGWIPANKFENFKKKYNINS